MSRFVFFSIISLALTVIGASWADVPAGCGNIESSYLVEKNFTGSYRLQHVFSYDQYWRPVGIVAREYWGWDDPIIGSIVYKDTVQYRNGIRKLESGKWGYSPFRVLISGSIDADTSIYQSQKSGGAWTPYKREIRHYTESGKPALEEEWNWANVAYEFRGRTKYEYDRNDSLVKITSEGMFGHQTVTYRYLGQNGLLDSTVYEYESNRRSVRAWFYTLDEKMRVTEVIEKYKSIESLDWEEMYRTVNRYSPGLSADSITESSFYSWADGGWYFVYTEKDSSFHLGNTRIISPVAGESDFLIERYISHYDCMGNLLTKDLQSSEDGTRWDNIRGEQYHYEYVKSKEPVVAAIPSAGRAELVSAQICRGVLKISELPSEALSVEVFDLRGRLLRKMVLGEVGRRNVSLPIIAPVSKSMLVRIKDDQGRLIWSGHALNVR